MKQVLLAICMMMATMTSWAQYARVNDIAYSTSDNPYAKERCKLDVYYPTDIKDAPVVVWFHGGGIEAGNKHIDAELQEQGLVVIAVNYRLLPKATIDEVLDDAAAAVAWAFKHAAEYNGSARKIFVTGHSAGGYLTDLIGLDKKWLAKYGIDANEIAALVPFSGQAVTHYNIRKQQGVGPLQATIDDYAPLTHIRKDAPPMVIISGDRELELFGRYEEQAYFWRMLKLTGHPDVTLYEMQGFDHGQMLHPAYHVLKQTIKRIEKEKASATKEKIEFHLWPKGAPTSNGIKEPEKANPHFVVNVTDPVLTVYLPKKPCGLAVIDCPGGSYLQVWQGTEGHNMAEWYNEQGIVYAVLKYRLPNTHYEVPLDDVHAAMRIMKEHQTEYQFSKLGIQGCSAGGHLASTAATHYTSTDNRPDFQILFYPVISFNDEFTHRPTREFLIGKDAPAELVQKYSNELQVTKDTPAAFIAASTDDGLVPVRNSVEYYNALVANGVSADMHLYPTGGHGWFGNTRFSHRDNCFDDLRIWLMEQLKKK